MALKDQLLAFATKIGLVKNSGTPAQKTAKPAGQKFDVNLYMQATKQFWTTFFKKSVPDFFQNIGPKLQAYPQWIKGLSKDELASHIVVYTGVLFVFVGFILIIVL